MSADRPDPPAPAPSEPCVFGCRSTGWRWIPPLGWTRACILHLGHPKSVRRGLFVPDAVNVARAAADPRAQAGGSPGCGG